MRVFVAGATGAVGRSLVPQLIAAGHQVTAISRQSSRLQALASDRMAGIVCDVFDAAAVNHAVTRAAPDAIVHQLTDLPAQMDPRRMKEVYARNNRVRSEGTRNLIAAAKTAGVQRFVVQSMATWYRPEGGAIKTEDAPLWTDAPEPIGEAVRTVVQMETDVLANFPDAVVLRYGGFYGPGTWYTADGQIAVRMRKRMFPIVGSGAGLTSFIHVDDAASAAVAALSGPRGVYNVADDEPARAREWIPAFAAAVGAPPPRTVPEFLAKLVLGKALATWLITMRGASNERARRELGWRPSHPSWREGFRTMGR